MRRVPLISLVDRVAGERTSRRADDAADRTEQAADGRARGLKQDGCHAARPISVDWFSFREGEDSGILFPRKGQWAWT